MALADGEGPRARSGEGPPVRRRDWPVLAVLIATMLAFAGSVLYAEHVAARLDGGVMSVARNTAPAIEHLSAARGHLLRLELALSVATHPSAGASRFDRETVDVPLAALHRQLAAYRALPFYPHESERYAEVERGIGALEVQRSTLLDRLAAGDREGAGAALRSGFTPASAHVVEALDALVAFNVEQQRRLGVELAAQRRHGARVGYALEATTAALALMLMALVMRANRQHQRLLVEQHRAEAAHASELAAFAARLESLIRSSARIAQTISASDDSPRVFQTIAEEARALVSAQYCAVGCGTDPSLPFDPWISAGAPTAAVEALGHPPRPDGLLGAVIREGRTTRIADLTDHAAFKGLSEPQPPMGAFLGVPILHAGANVGNLFLMRSPGDAPFSEGDERVAALLAGYAGVSISNARLFKARVAATRAREDLLATVSHDLKNPLNAIHLAAGLLRRQSAAGTGDLLDRIDRSVARMTGLISDLLDAAKIEAGALRVARQQVDAGVLVDSAAELLRIVAAARSVRLVPLLPARAVVVSCERSLILRVLSNLLGNAIKFSPEGSSVTVGVESVHGSALFTVKDAGPGIPPDLLPHVFDRYWQQKDGDRRGSGLGLYIAKGIVEAHGGRIWIESVPGEGTASHFTLPEGPGDVDADPATPADPLHRSVYAGSGPAVA